VVDEDHFEWLVQPLHDGDDPAMKLIEAARLVVDGKDEAKRRGF
jgi:hypothetical protein